MVDTAEFGFIMRHVASNSTLGGHKKQNLMPTLGTQTKITNHHHLPAVKTIPL